MKTCEKVGNGTILVTDGSLKYIQFECLNKYSNILTHFMSTRHGGISTGECSTLNLGFNRNDDKANVRENFRLICSSTGIDTHSLVLAKQVHGTKVIMVDESDRGRGFEKENSIDKTDGLITVAPGVTLVTFHADCVPVFMFEPVIKAAALLHSGWRGTLANIVSSAAAEMRKITGFDAGRLVAVIGPSIGKCCFEVDEDVYNLFRERSFGEYCTTVPGGKWKIDLKGIIKKELVSEGVDEQNIYDSGLCTKCRSDLFFSHRADKGRTGSMAAFMQIKP